MTYQPHQSEDATLKVALDIAKWFVNGDRPDEWKLKEWAESLDPDAITKAYEWRCTGLPHECAALLDSASPAQCQKEGA